MRRNEKNWGVSNNTFANKIWLYTPKSITMTSIYKEFPSEITQPASINIAMTEAYYKQHDGRLFCICKKPNHFTCHCKNCPWSGVEITHVPEVMIKPNFMRHVGIRPSLFLWESVSLLDHCADVLEKNQDID